MQCSIVRKDKSNWKSCECGGVFFFPRFLRGATKVLAIEEEGQDLSDDDFAMVGSERSEWVLHVSVPGISLSLVSGYPAEIFHAFLDVITLDLEGGPTQQMLELNVGGLQVDNQLSTKVYDTVLWGKTTEGKPFVHVAVNRGLSGTGNDVGMLFFHGIEVIVQVWKKKK